MNLLAIAAFTIDRLRYWGALNEHLTLWEDGEGLTITFEGSPSRRGGIDWVIAGVTVDVAALGFVN